jgi:predicted amidohydrolase
VEANLAHAEELVEQAAQQGAQLIVLPELFSTGYEYSDRNFALPERLEGPTGLWIAKTARRLNIHLHGTFPARTPRGSYIASMLAAPDGRHWIYRKVHVFFWENCYFDRGIEPVIAETDLGRIGLLTCWDQVFTDLARAYQGNVDLLCIASSPPTWLGALEDTEGCVLARTSELRSMGHTLDGVDWFCRAQVLHARSAGVPVVYAARCGTFLSSFPYGSSFLMTLKPGDALHVLRGAGTKYRIRCPMMGRSCVVNAAGERVASADQDGEAVLVATVQPGAPDPAVLPPVPKGKSLVPGIPRSQLWSENLLIWLGRWYASRHSRSYV